MTRPLTASELDFLIKRGYVRVLPKRPWRKRQTFVVTRAGVYLLEARERARADRT